SHELVLPAAFAGELTTRTDNDTGVVTVEDSEHTIETGDTVDAYWIDADGLMQVRYGMEATVSTVEITLDGGAGENLPAEDTEVTVSAQVEIDTDFAGDKA